MFYNLVLLLPCTLCLFGAVWLYCKRKNNTRTQYILSLCLLFSSVFFFCTANYIVGITDYATYWKLDIVDSAVTLLIIPTMYLYFRSLTYEGRFTWKDYIWFLPAFVVGIGTCVLYLAMNEAEAIYYISFALIKKIPNFEYAGDIYKVHHFISVDLFNFSALVQILGAGTSAVIYLRRYHYRLREFYSTLDDKSVDLDKKILFWFILTIPLALGIIPPKRTFWEQRPAWALLYFIGWTVVYFGICYYSSQKKYTVEDLAQELKQADLDAVRNDDHSQEEDHEDSENNVDDGTAGTKISKYAKYLSSFIILIEEDLVFLQNTLRADEVANRMHTNRTYLSRMIKEEFQCTFSDYINMKRVEYSQRLMRENPTMKQEELAEKSGFINAPSFSRTFKQIVGIPPKEWSKREVLFS